MASPLPTFTDEQVSLFQRRYDDLCIDKDYVTWININHPGFLPSTSGSTAGDESNMDMHDMMCDTGVHGVHDDDMNVIHSVPDVIADSRIVLACVGPVAVANSPISSVSNMNVLLDMPVSSFSTHI